MKKIKTAQPSKRKIIELQSNYYKEVGENAAMNIFIKEKTLKKKLKSISPPYKRFLSPDTKLNTEQELAILKDNKSRDISHLKDRVSPRNIRIDCLPSDIETIKNQLKRMKSVDEKRNNKISGSFRLKSELNYEEIHKSLSEDKFNIEKMYLSLPSGRQECENLKKWLENMKANYHTVDCFTENSLAIYTMCSKELIRQVYVNCNERGNLLQEVLDFFKNSCEQLYKNVQEWNNKCKDLTKIITETTAKNKENIVEKDKELEETHKHLELKLAKKTEKTKFLKQIIEDQKDLINSFRSKFHSEDEDSYAMFNSLRRATSFSKGSHLTLGSGSAKTFMPDLYKIKKTFENKYFNNKKGKKNCLIESFSQTDEKILQIESIICETIFNQASKEEENSKDKLKIESSSNPLEQVDDKNMPNSAVTLDEKEHDEANSKLPPLDIKISRLKAKKMTRKDIQKLSEVERKIIEKQNELDLTMKKIGQKNKELDFISKTIDFKKLKEAFLLQQSQEIGYENVIMKKPAFDKDFNILVDSRYWDDDILNKSKGMRRTSTLNQNKIESLQKQRTISEKGEEFGLENDNNLLKGDHSVDDPSIYDMDNPLNDNLSEIDSFEELPQITYHFEKKSVSSLLNLSEIYDFNLYKARKNPRKTQAYKILEKICTKDINWIKSKGILSRKLIHKKILSQYLSFYSKDYISDSLLDFSYYTFHQRYGLKIVSERKFIEFICSLILYETSRKCCNFLRFIGAGQKINKKNYSKQAFEVYLDCLSVLMNSKSVISISDDPAEKLMIPIFKATELVKEKLEKIDKTQILRTISILEYKAIQDPKKISIHGLIDGEYVIELIIEVYESLKSNYLDGLQFIINIIRYKEAKDELLKYEISIVMRAICPLKVADFEAHYEYANFLSIQEMCCYCIDNSLFSLNDIKAFYTDEFISESDAENLINNSIEELFSIINEIEATNEYMKTLSQQIWELKLKILIKSVQTRNAYESMYAFKIYSIELNRIRSMFL